MRDLKATVWPSGTRAFSYDCWPGTLQPRTDNALTVSINVIPTLAPIAGAKIGADIAKKLDGHSLAEHLKSNAGVFQRDRLLFKHGGRWESGFAEKHKHNQAAVHHRDLMAIRIDSDCGCKEGVCVRGRAISNGQFKPMVYT